MNDRFKFRVWDKGNDCFVDLENVDMLYHNPNGNFMLGFYDAVQGDMKYMPQTDIVVEQCTGLKDNCGNLIYEGDIIKDRFGRKFKVVWSQEDVMFDGRMIIYDPEYSNRYDLYEGATDDVEIIGNIHEQKEQQ